MGPAPLTARRPWPLAAAAFVCVMSVVPPVSHLAQRYELGLLLRYGTWALVVPALVALGAPWPNMGAAASLDRSRARHRELLRTIGFFVVDAFVMVWWFTPTGAKAVSGSPWLTALEALSLIAAGIGLWLELVESSLLRPRGGRLRCVAFGSIAMWLVWTEAYLVGMAQSGWYRNFTHVAGHGLSQAADQQVGSGVLWFLGTVVFVPVIFVNALHWLHGEQEPDAELRRLVRDSSRASAWPAGRGAADRY